MQNQGREVVPDGPVQGLPADSFQRARVMQEELRRRRN